MRLRMRAQAASRGIGCGGGTPQRWHQLRMADLRATLGMRRGEEGLRSRKRPGGEKAKSAQAWTQLRSKVWPEGGTMTGSAMREREMGHRNSTGISDTVMEDVGALPEAEEGERWSLENLQNDLRLPIHSPVAPSSRLAIYSSPLLTVVSSLFFLLFPFSLYQDDGKEQLLAFIREDFSGSTQAVLPLQHSSLALLVVHASVGPLSAQ
ncbi:hypothetical protein C4D60_Mb09t13200 [Musa balbisiana]|uniref:Uncharacterized protein n=1 Tax=Musa balbisiana TaxID=52838 RepID=A0A4S8IG19_MUSBA|nr:hypothetical protein C4D60_Mb09t13200 [Musa balbisiana]